MTYLKLRHFVNKSILELFDSPVEYSAEATCYLEIFFP